MGGKRRDKSFVTDPGSSNQRFDAMRKGPIASACDIDE